VVDYFINEYKKGRTPNPCIMCNQFIKFDLLLKKALALGADYLATGHYVRLWRTNPISPIGPIRLIGLFQAKDKTKDQSYFLWTLTQEQLKHLLFPIGNYTKEEVRKMAKKWQLPTAERAESQGLCFIGYWSNRQFLEKFIHPKPGPVKDLKGNVLGTHEGLPFYTIGQRKGLPELRIKNYDLKRKGEIPPLYVLKLDQKNNTLIVGEEKDLYQKELLVEEVNWIGKFNLANETNETNETNGIDLKAKIRYGHPVMPCKVSSLKPTYEQKGRVNKAESQNPKLKVVFSKPVRAITPGQSIVFYKGEELLGGGVIK
jgi:tRNA-specific 2-thiouridylase